MLIPEGFNLRHIAPVSRGEVGHIVRMGFSVNVIQATCTEKIRKKNISQNVALFCRQLAYCFWV